VGNEKGPLEVSGLNFSLIGQAVPKYHILRENTSVFVSLVRVGLSIWGFSVLGLFAGTFAKHLNRSSLVEFPVDNTQQLCYYLSQEGSTPETERHSLEPPQTETTMTDITTNTLTAAEFNANVRPELERAFTLITRNRVQSVEIARMSDGTTDSFSNGVRHGGTEFYTVTGETIEGYETEGEFADSYVNEFNTDLYSLYIDAGTEEF